MRSQLALAAATLVLSGHAMRVIETARINDNREAAGHLAGGVLSVRLETRLVKWFPEGTNGPAIQVFAFGEVGKQARIPGPLLRVQSGTEVRVTVRNAVDVPVRMMGLQDHASPTDTVVIAADSSREFRFTATVPGTYYYWGRTHPTNMRGGAPVWAPGPGRTRDAMLVGAFVVDSVGAKPEKNERIIMLSRFSDSLPDVGIKSDEADRVLRRELVARENWFVLTMNGLSWPHTERLSYTVGDTIHWRVINAGALPHPMHLHGFYFDIVSRGDAQRDTVFAARDRRQAVTELLRSGSTLGMRWVPTRPGNWLFHCHFTTHITEHLRILAGDARARERHGNHAEESMAGLVMGIRVAPRKGVALAAANTDRARRKVRVFVTQRANVYGDQPGLSYIVQEGPNPPAPDSVRLPSSPIVLRQNEPTEITVLNRSRAMASIHWHGVELESYYDGVGGWSGSGTRVAPVIAPNDSFVVRITPPRAGTFIYHTHSNESVQLPSGLYGTLIVLPENAAPDTTERVLLIGIGGPTDEGRPVVNGSSTPGAVELRHGVAHRFRFINISPLESHTIQLVAGRSVQQWRALAKDGADLPVHLQMLIPSTLVLHPGETYDFEVSRAGAELLTLRISSAETTANRLAASARNTQPGRIETEIPVIVR
jgi:FtsP/CotA-like multicopper oxidase with cupredoxin domain